MLIEFVEEKEPERFFGNSLFQNYFENGLQPGLYPISDNTMLILNPWWIGLRTDWVSDNTQSIIPSINQHSVMHPLANERTDQ